MTVALIAGQGDLPPHLANILARRGKTPLVYELEQFPSSIADNIARTRFRLEHFGSFLENLRALKVRHLCMAGSMKRVPLNPALVDAATMPLIPRLKTGLAKGDDGTLRMFIEIFEERGIEVIGAADIDPELLPAAGIVNGPLPAGIENEVNVAMSALSEMALKDLGQAVVVRNAKIAQREDENGTDAMLQKEIPKSVMAEIPDVTGLIDEENLENAVSRISCIRGEYIDNIDGILFKAPKPGQEMRADMPLVGIATAINAALAGLSGIVVEAGGVMVLNRALVRRLLESLGMFMWIMPRGRHER
ncbi:MAG: UDP-2,3-diacylglucosamine diphosphatase LpxI [Roseovarius sp.]|nr:UDP-2,3-diacylglucosamine diphosphatase LpxI [Roseovarius sp.]